MLKSRRVLSPAGKIDPRRKKLIKLAVQLVAVETRAKKEKQAIEKKITKLRDECPHDWGKWTRAKPRNYYAGNIGNFYGQSKCFNRFSFRKRVCSICGKIEHKKGKLMFLYS